jgi:hypothetical protein
MIGTKRILPTLLLALQVKEKAKQLALVVAGRVGSRKNSGSG